jgi:uncharacterized membrane protein
MSKKQFTLVAFGTACVVLVVAAFRFPEAAAAAVAIAGAIIGGVIGIQL